MYSKEIENYKAALKLTRKQREILVGLMLGDGHLESQNRGKTYRLKLEYCVKNSEYCQHLHEVFREWVLRPPKKKSKSCNGHLSSNIAFSTVSHGAFRFYARQFYRDGKKVVPTMTHKLLTARGLAYWFMDDGSMKSAQSKGTILNTQGFNRQEVAMLVDLLEDKFKLNAKERRQKEGYQIYISGNSYEELLSLIGNLIHPSMRYKIPTPRRTQLPKM